MLPTFMGSLVLHQLDPTIRLPIPPRESFRISTPLVEETGETAKFIPGSTHCLVKCEPSLVSEGRRNFRPHDITADGL